MKQVKNVVDYWCDDTVKKRYLGQGITVAVMDTGIALHPDFDNRIVYFRDIIYERNMIYDDNGHGTHVSGIIGGSGKISQGYFSGMAPLSRLIMVKVLDEKGNGDIKNVIKGVRWILENRKKYRIRIVNISVGTLPNTADKGAEALLKAVEELWDAGLIVVAAAGNYGPGEGSITIPGISKKIITVGSSNDQSGTFSGKKKYYSGRGPTKECVVKPDVIAPGSGVSSCNAKYNRTENPYVIKSGTSMATPIVSGAVAVLLSKYPDMSNVEVKLRLRESCVDMGYGRNRQGWGLLNVKRLLGK